MYQVSHKDPKEGGADPATLGYSTQDDDTATSGDPWVEDTNLNLARWNLSLRCFHIRPAIFSLHSCETSLSWWILGNAAEKPQNATYVARPRCDMLYCIRESRQYIVS